MKPQMKRKGIATAMEGKVCQKLVVTRWLVNLGMSGPCSGFQNNRYAVGQTNMYSAPMSGTYTNNRDRNGFGVRPIFFNSHPQKSCRARMWQPQPQTKRPKINVAKIARAKKMNPALTNPFCNVCMVSEGSMGETVLPMMRH